jgi:hypothetical protein
VGCERPASARCATSSRARETINLAADLTADAVVAVPGLAMTLRRMTVLSWSHDRRSVLATVEAVDADGVVYTLRYELDVRRVDERWEIAAIQTDPTS